MSESGYIYFWRKDDEAGNIHICKGNFPGLNVFFDLAECDKPLQKELKQININTKKVCPPPDGALLVDFDLAVDEGDMIATNVSQAA